MSFKLDYRSIPDIVSLIPYLIGFYPNDSVVVIASNNQTLEVTARLDWAPGMTGEAIRAVKRSIAEQLDVGDFFVAVYTDDPDLAAESRRAATKGRWVQVVTGGFRLEPNSPIIAFDSATSPSAVSAVFQGFQIYESREKLSEIVAGLNEGHLPKWRELAAKFKGEYDSGCLDPAEQVFNSLSSFGHGGLVAGIAECCAVAVALDNPQVRDEIWPIFHRRNAYRLRQYWAEIVRNTPSEALIRPLVFLGISAWLGGDGALLNICLERVTEIDPIMARETLLYLISSAMIPPTAWDDLIDLEAEPRYSWWDGEQKRGRCA